MTFKHSIALFFLAVSLIGFTACDKNDDETSTDFAEVDFHFNYLVNGAAYTPGEVYDINGTKVSFETVNFYIGDMTFMPEEGDPTAFSGDHLLITPDAGHQEVGEVEAGHYHMVSFFVGVTENANNQTETDFTSRDASDPLAEQTPSMHWSWNSGYKFVRIDGSVDTDGDDIPDTGLVFHLGTDNRRTTLQFMSHRDLEKGSNEVEFDFDIAKLFTNIDLSTNYNFHTTPTETATADAFVANLVNALTMK